jgi:hypothetical protein
MTDEREACSNVINGRCKAVRRESDLTSKGSTIIVCFVLTFEMKSQLRG